MSPTEEEAVDGVCDVEQSEVPEMLPVLESGIFVEPLPDQIAVVYEYQQVQVYSYKEVMAGEAVILHCQTAVIAKVTRTRGILSIFIKPYLIYSLMQAHRFHEFILSVSSSDQAFTRNGLP